VTAVEAEEDGDTLHSIVVAHDPPDLLAFCVRPGVRRAASERQSPALTPGQ
jgi:hypothetical protein